ncbi:MAG: hypothetical protein GY711_08575 [bacterium]|nr:hypothetical protein [bacterium]
MRIGLLVGLWTCVSVTAVSARAQEQAAKAAIEDGVDDAAAGAVQSIGLRVSFAKPGGLVVIDRGADVGVAPGDLVLFHSRDGNTYQGTVVELDDRSAVVELAGGVVALETGTKGEVLVPEKRIVSRRAPEQIVPEQLPWETADEDWTEGMPLLAQVDAVRPEQRRREVTARAYSIGDMTYTSEDSRSDSFFRAGGDVEIENGWGRGGRLHIDWEHNLRQTDLDDQDDEDFSDLRVDRLSYAWGGTRFDHEGWEAGRFLMRGMPEFGVVDGVEYGHRLSNGQRFGLSTGWMPEPDTDFESGGDFQVSGYYHWAKDGNELLTLDTGFQKTWHNGRGDRDLIVSKLQYLPLVGWNFHGTTWIDWYSSGDDTKGSGPELTRALLSTGHRWEGGHGMNVNFRHSEFPEIRRFEFTPVAVDQLEDDRNDRLSIAGWRRTSERQRVHAEIGVFDDEDESGGDLELGVDVKDLWTERSRGDVTFFNTHGEFSKVIGTRLLYSKFTRRGHWDALYEIARHDQEGFEDNDDILQHRIRGSHDFRFDGDWDLSVYAQAVLWDSEQSWSLGFYVQKSF